MNNDPYDNFNSLVMPSSLLLGQTVNAAKWNSYCDFWRVVGDLYSSKTGSLVNELRKNMLGISWKRV